MINHKQSKEKIEMLRNHSDVKRLWKSSVPSDKLVGIHDIVSRYKVSSVDVAYQMSRLVGSKLVPVVFICYGKIPKFMRHSIEMASRLNPVIVFNDAFTDPAITSQFDNSEGFSPLPVFYIPIDYKKIGEISEFDAHYEPIYLIYDLPVRQDYERRCFFRWFVLANAASVFNLPNVFYADNDVLVAGNVTTALAVRRATQRCDVILSVQGEQPTNLEHWIGHYSGHSSFWSQESLQDWKDFLLSMYRSHKDTLRVAVKTVSTAHGHNRVVDMTLLFLYYVAHHLGSTMWDAGRPQSFGTGRLRRNAKQMEDVWSRYDFKFKQARDSFSLPHVSNPSLIVCNGLDVIDRACFDHMHAFYSTLFSPNINTSHHLLLKHYHHRQHPLNVTYFQDQAVTVHDPLTHFLPRIKGSTSYFGGRAESFDKSEVKRLDNSDLYFYTLHYQGSSKNWILIDVCKRLVSRTQYYLEQYYNPRMQESDLEKVLSEPDNKIEELMLKRLLDPMVQQDCVDVLQNKDNLWPYMDMIKDRF